MEQTSENSQHDTTRGWQQPLLVNDSGSSSRNSRDSQTYQEPHRTQWTHNEEQKLMHAVESQHLTLEQVQQMLFPYRTLISLKRKYSRLTGTCMDSPLNRMQVCQTHHKTHREHHRDRGFEVKAAQPEPKSMVTLLEQLLGQLQLQ